MYHTGKDEEALQTMIKIYQDVNKAKEEIKSIKESFEQNVTKPSNSNGYSEKPPIDSNNNGFVNIELKSPGNSMNTQNQANQSYFAKLLSIIKDPSTRHCLLIGICLHIGQQFSGINTIMYYGATVIQMSGVLSKRIAILFTVVVGITNATTSFIALFVYDRVTRRKITLWSMCGIVVCLALMGTMFVKIDQ